MRNSPGRMLAIMAGLVGALAVGAATPTWSAAVLTGTAAVKAATINDLVNVRSQRIPHRVHHAVRPVDRPGDRVEFGASARVPPMRPHTGGTK
jgi:hypothetical protein